MTFEKLNRKEFKKLFPVTDNKVLAKKYKVAEGTIRTWASKLKLRKEKGRWTKAEIKMVLHSKMSYSKIAARIGRTRWAVVNKIRELKGLK